VLGGVFVRHAETKELVFQEGRAPSRGEIAVIAARVEKRMTRCLRRRDLVDERPAEDRSNEAPSRVSGSKIWRATWNIKASGKPANCSTGTIGAASEAQLALFKTSCESLHKK